MAGLGCAWEEVLGEAGCPGWAPSLWQLGQGSGSGLVVREGVGPEREQNHKNALLSVSQQAGPEADLSPVTETWGPWAAGPNPEVPPVSLGARSTHLAPWGAELCGQGSWVPCGVLCTRGARERPRGLEEAAATLSARSKASFKASVFEKSQTQHSGSCRFSTWGVWVGACTDAPLLGPSQPRGERRAPRGTSCPYLAWHMSGEQQRRLEAWAEQGKQGSHHLTFLSPLSLLSTHLPPTLILAPWDHLPNKLPALKS